MSIMNNEKKRIIISMFAIVLLILTLFGITYAYFSAKVKENENEESIKISAASMELSYDGEDSYVKITNLQPGEKIAEKKFSVTNDGTREVENYDVILENLVNELVMYEDLTYTLTCESSDGTECNGSNGVFPKTNQVIVTNSIASKVTHSYELILNYEETGKNQSLDMNKEISAKVNIKHDISSVKTFKIYGNSVQNGIPDINNSIEIESLGKIIDNENDANYKKFHLLVKVNDKQYNIYLNEPLRKLGDVSDYIDFENRILVRNIGEKVFDGTETMYTYENGVYYGLLHNPNVMGMSNYFSSNNDNESYLRTDVNENAIHFITANTAEEFKSLLTTNYNNNKPLKVLYRLNKNTFNSINVPIFDVDASSNISVCDTNNICASKIEVEFDE